MEARGRSTPEQFAVTFAIRVLQNAIGLLFYVFVIVGIDAYSGSYSSILGSSRSCPTATPARSSATILTFVAWAIGASIVQVLVYRRGLRRWPDDPLDPDPPPAPPARRRRPPPASGRGASTRARSSSPRPSRS